VKATATAPSNIALVKYWGKRDLALNVPATGSLSVTLDGLAAVTTVTFEEGLRADAFRLNGAEDPRGAARVSRFLDLVRERAGVRWHARVESRSNVPTGAGLASSAAGFAALALAADEALGLGLSTEELSALARRGSGSAARSLFDGFAEMREGRRADGSDAHAFQVAPADHLPLSILVAITTRGKKDVGSTEGMVRTERTSPYHLAWLEATRAALAEAREALLAKDLPRLGAIAEENCLRMHASMLAASPPLLYWNEATVAAIRAVRALRDEGTPAWFTIDAGPQVKVLCSSSDADAVRRRLVGTPGILEVLTTRPGPGARALAETA
jgi:diphosphomevalonate decarboxylase